MTTRQFSLFIISTVLLSACGASTSAPTTSTQDSNTSAPVVAETTAPAAMKDCGKAEYRGSMSNFTTEDNQAFSCFVEAFKSCAPATLEYNIGNTVFYKVLGPKGGDCLLSLHLPDETKKQGAFRNMPTDGTCALSQTIISKISSEPKLVALPQDQQDISLMFVIGAQFASLDPSLKTTRPPDCKPV